MRIFFAIFLFLFVSPSFAAELHRSADFGASVRSPADGSEGLEVMRVRSGGPADRAGIHTGDRILALNDQKLDARQFRKKYASLNRGESAKLQISRAGKQTAINMKVEELPPEHIDGAQIILDSVQTPAGYRVRTIVTRPVGEPLSKRLPVIFLVPWLSCDSTETPFGPMDGTAKLLHALASRSGFVLLRTDKPGLGDSEGPACEDVDFQTELAAYRSALASLKKYPFVDIDRIFLLGLSNGGGVAPLVAGQQAIAGYVVSGGWVKTWFEHMMEIERRRLSLSGETPSQINAHMAQFEEFYTEYLIRKQTPGEVIEKNPKFSKLWYDEPEHQYGRPAAFYQQLQELNLADAWQRVKAPVLAIYGEYDWIMSRADHEEIVDIVNRNKPGAARFVSIPKMDHGLTLQENMNGSFQNFGGGKWDDSLATMIIDWLKTSASARN